MAAGRSYAPRRPGSPGHPESRPAGHATPDPASPARTHHRRARCRRSASAVHDAVVVTACAGTAGAGAVPGEHLRRGPAIELHQVCLGAAPVEPGVTEMVPEPLRMPRPPRLLPSPGDELIDPGRGQRPAPVHPQPQLRTPRQRMQGTHAQVPVKTPGGLIADRDDAWPAALAEDPDLPPVQVQLAQGLLYHSHPETAARIPVAVTGMTSPQRQPAAC